MAMFTVASVASNSVRASHISWADVDILGILALINICKCFCQDFGHNATNLRFQIRRHLECKCLRFSA